MIVKQEKCKSPEHNPPPLMVYPPVEHVWKCPECGQEQRVLVLEPLLRVFKNAM